MKYFRYFLQIIYNLFSLLGVIISLIFFVLIIIGSTYYFIKPDLPPQQIREVVSSFLDTQTIDNIQKSSNISGALEVIEITVPQSR